MYVQSALDRYFFQAGNFLGLNKILSSSIHNGFCYFFLKMITSIYFYHCAKFQHCPYLQSEKKTYVTPPSPSGQVTSMTKSRTLLHTVNHFF